MDSVENSCSSTLARGQLGLATLLARALLLCVASCMMLCAASSLVSAANDPGHDSLYVLRFGDTDITGSINITGALNASYIRAAALLYGDQLDIRANGSIFSVSSRPAIQADANDLYLDAKGNLYLNTKGGTTGIIQVGPTTGSAITFNVSGVITQQGVLVCLANGTNCPGGNNSGNVSSISAGNGISVSGTTGDVTVSASAATCGAGEYSYWDGNSWECRADVSGGSSGAGWVNTTTTTSSALHVNVTAGNLTVANGYLGIGTSTPQAMLTVYGGESHIYGVSNDGATARLIRNDAAPGDGDFLGVLSFSDADGDSITYNFSVTGGCNSTARSGLTDTNVTIPLCRAFIYEWAVQACDGIACSEWTNRTLTTSAADTCTPPSGAVWSLDLADNCTISGVVNVTAWNITSTGTGTVTLSDVIITYVNKTIGTIAGNPRIIYGNNVTIRAGE